MRWVVQFHGPRSPRKCLREPIQAIFAAAEYLGAAADAHRSGDRRTAEDFIAKANQQEIRDWTESIWGPHDPDIHWLQEFADAPATLPAVARLRPHSPTAATRKSVIERDGYNCRFCGIPVIDPRIRTLLRADYPLALSWGRRNIDQHAAFQCMWLQFDHVLPNSRGGDSSIDNIIITCAPCNFGRMERTLDEVLLIDPRSRPIVRSDWDGLERVRQR